MHLAQYNREQFGKRQAAEAQLSAAQTQHEAVSEHIGQLESERVRLGRFWHYFKRRALERRIQADQAQLAAARSALAAAQAALEDISHAPAPEFPGLSLGARRSINLAAIAYAEVLCLRVASLKMPLDEARAGSHQPARGGRCLRQPAGVRAADGADHAGTEADRRTYGPCRGDPRPRRAAATGGALSAPPTTAHRSSTRLRSRKGTCWRSHRWAGMASASPTSLPRTPGICFGC